METNKIIEKARGEFEETLRNLNLRARTENEVRKMKEKKDCIYPKSLGENAHNDDFETIPDAHNSNDLERLAGRLGLHYNDTHE